MARLTLPIVPHYGPIVRADARRVVILQVLLLILMVVGFLFADSESLRTCAVGLTFPGAGFVHQGRLAAFVLSLGLFLSTMLLMLAGMWLFPTAVVVGSAVIAAIPAEASAGTGWSIAAWSLLPAWMTAQHLWRSRTAKAALRERQVYNALIAARTVVETAPWAGAAPGAGESDELNAEQLMHLRNLLDLALQPIDAYDGYDMIEQKGFAALRNQYLFQAYALSLAQYTHTPAFTGYASEASRNIIARMQHPMNWRYFTRFRRIAEFKFEPDPTTVIGYAGFLGVMIGMYEKLDGGGVYEEPQAITFRYDERIEFKYAFREFSERIAHLYLTDRFHCIPCEPMWYYPFCNSIGLQQMRLASEFYGKPWFEQIHPLYREALINEFCGADGRITTTRHRWLGIRAPMFDIPSMEFLNCWLTLPVVYDVAERGWATARRRYFADGRYIPGRWLADIDLGNYSTRLSVLPIVNAMLLAHGIGDGDMVASLRAQMQETARFVEYEGARGVEGGSTALNAVLTLVETSRPRALIDLVQKPHRAARAAGPIVSAVGYPDLLVASARTDGQALFVVLRPGRGHGGTFPIRFANLRAGQSYRMETPYQDVRITGGVDGTAQTRVVIDGRTVMRLLPVEVRGGATSCVA